LEHQNLQAVQAAAQASQQEAIIADTQAIANAFTGTTTHGSSHHCAHCSYSGPCIMHMVWMANGNTFSTPEVVIQDIVTGPPELKLAQKEVTLCIETFYVNKMPFSILFRRRLTIQRHNGFHSEKWNNIKKPWKLF
jgi:hypothetical protein